MAVCSFKSSLFSNINSLLYFYIDDILQLSYHHAILEAGERLEAGRDACVSLGDNKKRTHFPGPFMRVESP